MTEEFVHHLWKFRLFNQLSLTSTSNECIDILHVGVHNHNAGPDFFNSKIKINDTVWAGNVEVHKQASDWKKHGHQHDKAYDNIILHVVYNADEQIFRASGEAIPTLELKERIDTAYYVNYLKFKNSTDWIPCEKQINTVPTYIWNTALPRLLIERFEEKSQQIQLVLERNKMNWEETFYQILARSFGFKTNTAAFELLATSLPVMVLAKHKNSLLQVEALLFGQAGFLNMHLSDRYAQQLQNEYVFLKQKFKLIPIENHLWKFLRLRPVNFPTIRIAQFANLIYQSSHLFSKVMETEELSDLKVLFNTDVSAYWQTHYLFDKPTAKKEKKLGDDAAEVLIINTIVPFLFLYGKAKGEQKYTDKALSLLEEMRGEKNSIVSKWKALKSPVSHASQTQALLQLKQNYCEQKKCLQCAIGNYLFKKS